MKPSDSRMPVLLAVYNLILTCTEGGVAPLWPPDTYHIYPSLLVNLIRFCGQALPFPI